MGFGLRRSFADLNFSGGAANYIGVPWVYIS
jgi:hypothetical protein